MNNKSFRDKLDSELKDVVFTDKSRNKVLERAAERRKAALHENADIHGRVTSRDRTAIHDSTALYKGAVGCGSADGNGGAASHGRTASPDRRVSGARVWRERLQSFMNLELRIPVKPLVVALLITASGIVYACFGITRVSAEDIRKSSITVVEGNMGGQADGIYKDKD